MYTFIVDLAITIVYLISLQAVHCVPTISYTLADLYPFYRRSRKKQYEPAVKNAAFSTVYTKDSDSSDEVVTITTEQGQGC